jgi:hypothetical protein
MLSIKLSHCCCYHLCFSPRITAATTGIPLAIGKDHSSNGISSREDPVMLQLKSRSEEDAVALLAEGEEQRRYGGAAAG